MITAWLSGQCPPPGELMPLLPAVRALPYGEFAGCRERVPGTVGVEMSAAASIGALYFGVRRGLVRGALRLGSAR